MDAFDYVMTLLSFIYALAIAHILATIGDLATAGRRVSFSWPNLIWMVNCMMPIFAWWIGLWDLRSAGAWTTGMIALLVATAVTLYLLARLVCMRVPDAGVVDQREFHATERHKYLALYAFAALQGIGFNYLADIPNGTSQNLAVLPMAVAALIALIFGNRWIQLVMPAVSFALWAWFFAGLQAPLS